MLNDMQSGTHDVDMHWYVMRDLKRANAKSPAYRMLQDLRFEVFTPMKEHVTVRKGVRIREEIPVLQDLLFVHSDRSSLDPVVGRTVTLQYRYLRNRWREPMTVSDPDMERFIHAVNSAGSPRYYLPGELTPDMYGRSVRIVGGVLDGYEGKLLSARGSKFRRLVVEIPNLLTAAVQVEPEYIVLI